MRTPPRNDFHPPPPPEAFGTPANYIYFDLIVSYLIILTTKFVKLPILWSQISPCRPKTNFVKLFPWPFRALPPGPGQSKQQHPPRYLSTPPNENMKIRLCSIPLLDTGYHKYYILSHPITLAVTNYNNNRRFNSQVVNN